MRAAPIVGPLLLVVAASACGSSTEPDAVIGTWYLQSYNDSTVPGTAVYRSAIDSSLITIDSVRLVLEDGAACTWLVHLVGAAPNATADCVWTLDASPDDILVTILDSYTLRGTAAAAALSVDDPTGNLLVFGREPPGPVEPNPAVGVTSRSEPGYPR
jgi:hypothetical protein